MIPCSNASEAASAMIDIAKVRKFIFDVGMVWMEAFLYSKGIQLTAAHSGGPCSDLTQDEVQHLRRYNLYSQR